MPVSVGLSVGLLKKLNFIVIFGGVSLGSRNSFLDLW